MTKKEALNLKIGDVFMVKKDHKIGIWKVVKEQKHHNCEVIYTNSTYCDFMFGNVNRKDLCNFKIIDPKKYPEYFI
jgi:flagellar motor switch protein FliM